MFVPHVFSSMFLSFFYFCPICFSFLGAKDSRTALHSAAEYGHLDVVRVLLPFVDKDLPDACGTTALHFAAVNGQLEAGAW